MWWRKKEQIIKSEEYIELKQDYNKLRLQVANLEMDLQLYVKKLKLSKGLGKKEEEETETEKFNNNVIIPT